MSAAAGLFETLGRRIAPPRFLAFLVLLPLGTLGWRAFDPAAGWADALAIGFDLASGLFLLTLIPLLRDSSAATIRGHAAANDANRPLVLTITTVVALVVMTTISGELSDARSGNPWAMARLLTTLVLIWLFANSVYALHYAHAWYAGDSGNKGDRKGIDFPGTAAPDYGDFAYFAFTLGMTFQTSDIAITSPAIRRIALYHSLAAFVFNLGVIAFVINALGGG